MWIQIRVTVCWLRVELGGVSVRRGVDCGDETKTFRNFPRQNRGLGQRWDTPMFESIVTMVRDEGLTRLPACFVTSLLT